MPKRARLLALQEDRMMHEATVAFERSVERLKQSAERMGPSSKCIMKAKCLTMQDWYGHLAGFNFIKNKAKDCDFTEYGHYYRVLRKHSEETKRFQGE